MKLIFLRQKTNNLNKKLASLKKLIEFQGLALITLLIFYVLISSLFLFKAGFPGGLNYFLLGSQTPLFSQKIFGPPSEPIISLSTSCQETGPRIIIDWQEDDNATSFDVFRNGSILITGLVNSFYIDDNLEDETEYAYYVSANGPMGSVQSEISSITTDPCEIFSQTHEIRISTFDGQTVINHNLYYESEDRTPTFSGTTTIKNALIVIELHGEETIFTALTANENGYWNWTPVSEVEHGDYVMYLTATNPQYGSQFVSNVFHFEIVEKGDEDEEDGDEEDEEDEDETKDEEQTIKYQLPTQTQIEPKESKQIAREENQEPVDFEILLKNVKEIEKEGKLELELSLREIRDDLYGRKAILRIAIFDGEGRIIATDISELILYQDQKISRRISISCLESDVLHHIRGEIEIDEIKISRQIDLEFPSSLRCQKDSPTGLETKLVSSNFSIGFLIDWLGWLVIGMLFLLFVLILIFLRLTSDKSKN